MVVCVPGSSHTTVYGPTPPTAETVAVPSQAMSVDVFVLDVVNTSGAGSVTVTVSVAEHPYWSLTVTVYVPPDATIDAEFAPVLQAYVYGAVPPVPFASIVVISP
jgi:hypothetical protein